MTTPLTNWAGNITFCAARVTSPDSVDELQQIVAGSTGCARSARATRSAPSPTRPATWSRCVGLPRSVWWTGASTVTVSAGLSYGELAGQLHAQGWALPNLGLAAAHLGRRRVRDRHARVGRPLGCLATSVSRPCEMVPPTVSWSRCSRDDADFPGAVVALGCLGVVTAVTLDVVPTFDVAPDRLRRPAPRDGSLEHFDEVFDSAYSVSVFTDWRGADCAQVWRKDRVEDGPRTCGAATGWARRRPTGRATRSPGMDPVARDGAARRAGPVARAAAALPGSTSRRARRGAAVGVPASRASTAAAAFDGGREHARQVAPALQISEIRTVAADDLWLSLAYGRDRVALHFTWVADETRRRAGDRRGRAAHWSRSRRARTGASCSRTPPEAVREALCAAGRLPTSCAAPGPDEQVRQRIRRSAPGHTGN